MTVREWERRKGTVGTADVDDLALALMFVFAFAFHFNNIDLHDSRTLDLLAS